MRGTEVSLVGEMTESLREVSRSAEELSKDLRRQATAAARLANLHAVAGLRRIAEETR